MALDPRIEAVRAKYSLQKDDFWQLPQNKSTWLVKHAALEAVAAQAGVEWVPPQIIQADTANGIAVMVATGRLDDREEWSVGEASPKNNRNQYPWAMAEKRAKDRVILKLVGLHGFVYSEDEMPNVPVSAAEQKRSLDRIKDDLVDCNSLVSFEKCANEWWGRAQQENWSNDYKKEARKIFDRRKAELENGSQQSQEQVWEPA